MARLPKQLQIMEGLAGRGYCSPDPVRVCVGAFYFDLLHVSEFVRDDGIEGSRIIYGEEQQPNISLPAFQERQRRPESLFRKPDSVGQSNQHRIMVPSKGLSAEKSIAESLRLLLHDVKDLCRVTSLREVANEVGFLRRDHHADLLDSSSDHALDQILGNSLRAFHAIDHPAAYGQQLLRTTQRLNALSGAGCGNDSDHATSLLARQRSLLAACSMAATNSRARCSPVCSASVRSLARCVIFASSESGSSSARRTSSVQFAISNSRSGSKNESSPSNQSVTMGVPHAAASKNRPEGQ